MKKIGSLLLTIFLVSGNVLLFQATEDVTSDVSTIQVEEESIENNEIKEEDTTINELLESTDNVEAIKVENKEFESRNTQMDDGKYIYFLDANKNVLYREEKVKSGQYKIIHQYYSNVKFADANRDNKIRYHYRVRDNNTLYYRVETEINTQKILFIHEYYSNVKFADTNRDNKIHYHYHMNADWTIKYRVEVENNTQKILFIHEYYSNSIFEMANRDLNIRYHYHMNADWSIRHRVETEKITQKWLFIHEFYPNSTYDFQNPQKMEGNIVLHFHLNNDQSLKFANETERGTPNKILKRYYYLEGTFYGQGHGYRITKVEDLTGSNKTTWPVPNGYVTCGIGCYSGHTGVDVAVQRAPGNSINSILSGKIIKVNNGCATTGSYGCGEGFGNYVIVHSVYNGQNYVIMYAHMQLNSKTVNVGDTVQSGQKIGAIGDSGSSEGYHVHVEVIKGRTTWTNSKGPGGREGIDFRREFGL